MTRHPAATAFVLALFITTSASADVCRSPVCRPGDRVLLINTRPVGCSTSAERLARKTKAAERIDGVWQSSTPSALLGSLDPSVPTVVFIHGNQIDAAHARTRGLDVYRQFVRCADDRPIQFVLFSWCSGKERGLLNDFRIKAARTRPAGWQLAWTLNQMPPGGPVGLLGYSYGARVASGAVHLLAGGSLSGLTIAETSVAETSPRPLRAVYLAAAFDACWLAPRQYHGQAMHRLDSLLVTTNRSDLAMRLFKFSTRNYNPSAMGTKGPQGLDAESASKICTINVGKSVGRSHDLYRYMAAPGLMRIAWHRLTFREKGAGRGQRTAVGFLSDNKKNAIVEGPLSSTLRFPPYHSSCLLAKPISTVHGSLTPGSPSP